MPPPILQLISASVRFGASVALEPTDLAVQSARTTVLLGPSGCGKTTALRLMLGLLQPDTGQVLFEQAPLTRERLLRARAHMGYVVQDGGLFPHLTARGNVELMARHLGWRATHETARDRAGGAGAAARAHFSAASKRHLGWARSSAWP